MDELTAGLKLYLLDLDERTVELCVNEPAHMHYNLVQAHSHQIPSGQVSSNSLGDLEACLPRKLYAFMRLLLGDFCLGLVWALLGPCGVICRAI